MQSGAAAGWICLAVLASLTFGFRAHAATVFVQPATVSYSAGSTINTPSVLVGDVSSLTGSHPAPGGGGGGTSWYASTWAGQYLSFDFSSAMPLLSFHLWDYYDHSAESYQLVLYDGAGGTGNEIYNSVMNISPNRGGSTFTQRWDLDFGGEVSGVLSGRLYLQGADNSPTYPNAGLAEIGFMATPEPSRTVLLLAGMLAMLFSRRRG